MRACLAVLALLLELQGVAQAGELKAAGFIDLRVIGPSDEQSWLHGGLGKARFDGSGGQDVDGEIPQVMLDTRLQILADLSGFLSLRYAPDQKTAVDIMEGYLKYRPVSTTPWRWSIKLGAFFPPISLENTEIGWTSLWTLTPSAINSWVGDELRTIGGESTLEWRRPSGVFALRAAVYAWNDPAGILLADRGWALGDKPTGLFDRLRLPDATAALYGAQPPLHTLMYKEIDKSPGWYAGLSWTADGVGRFEILRYDNAADPGAFDRQFAWLTEFWSAGMALPFGDFTLLTQGMIGSTTVGTGQYQSVTDFDSAYALIGWTRGPVRLAARAEIFGTVERHPHDDDDVSPELSEHGFALTFAANWQPLTYLRLSAEFMRIDSFRSEREITGSSPRAIENQTQLNARIYF